MIYLNQNLSKSSKIIIEEKGVLHNLNECYKDQLISDESLITIQNKYFYDHYILSFKNDKIIEIDINNEKIKKIFVQEKFSIFLTFSNKLLIIGVKDYIIYDKLTELKDLIIITQNEIIVEIHILFEILFILTERNLYYYKNSNIEQIIFTLNTCFKNITMIVPKCYKDSNNIGNFNIYILLENGQIFVSHKFDFKRNLNKLIILKLNNTEDYFVHNIIEGENGNFLIIMKDSEKNA